MRYIPQDVSLFIVALTITLTSLRPVANLRTIRQTFQLCRLRLLIPRQLEVIAASPIPLK
jgi:hypothetical protein